MPEVVNIFKEIKEQPDQLYEMIRTDIRETIGQYYNYLQKLDRAIRCMIACKNIEEARQNAQSAEAA